MADEPQYKDVTFRALMEQEAQPTIYAPSLKNEPLQVKLYGVEQAGIWVECQALTDAVLSAFNDASWPTTPLFFVPYSSILWAMVQLVDMPSFSSEKLGL